MGALGLTLLTSLYFQCGAGISPETLHAIVETESSRNPYVIANVDDKTSHVFNTKQEAVAYADFLQNSGKKYSAGLMQIYSSNFEHYDLNNETVFNNCMNINVGAQILKQCYTRSKKNNDGDDLHHLKKAFSCYYSGNFERGFSEKDNYVERVLSNYTSIYSVPTYASYAVNSSVDLNSGGSLKPPSKHDEVFKEEVSVKTDSWDVFSDFK